MNMDKMASMVIREMQSAGQEKESFRPMIDPVPVSGMVRGWKEVANLIHVVMEQWYTEGPWVDRFERRLANYFHSRSVSFCNSGSSANLLAVSALTSPKINPRKNFGREPLRKGDRVLTTALSFPTTIAPMLWNGLHPVFIDVDLKTLVPTEQMIMEAVERWKPKLVMMAHTLGNPWPVDILDRTRRYVIEDNCDALGSKLNGKLTGTYGDLSTQSFYPAHQISTGEGGAVVTDRAWLGKIVESFRDWGRDCWCAPGDENTCGRRFDWSLGDLPEGYDHKYIYSHWGFNLKSTDFQAAIGLAQLDRLDGFIEKRKSNFRYMREKMRHLDMFFIPPEASPDSDPSWFGYPITLQDKLPFNRENLIRYLNDRNIHTRNVFAGNIFKQPLREHNLNGWLESSVVYVSDTMGQLKNTNKIMKDTFWVGVFPGISRPMMDFVVETIDSFLFDFQLSDFLPMNHE